MPVRVFEVWDPADRSESPHHESMTQLEIIIVLEKILLM
jgi:hypothetical protein